MSRHPLDPVFAKIDRAEAHIKELNTAIGEFLRTDPYRIEPKLNRKGDKDVWSIVPDPIPDVIESIAHDAVHNIRTPLDKMLTADFRNSNIHTKRAVVGSIAFPTGDSQKSFERALAEQEKHLTRPVIEFLEAAQPYVGGRGSSLWAVNKLDNRDKHRTLLVATKLAMQTTNVAELKLWKGFLWSLGSRRGHHLVPVPDAKPGQWDLHQPVLALRPIFRNNPILMKGGYLEFASAHDDMEFMTTTPGAKVEVNLKPVLNIAFSEIRGFEGEPVVKLIERMREAVKATLVAFRESFF